MEKANTFILTNPINLMHAFLSPILLCFLLKERLAWKLIVGNSIFSNIAFKLPSQTVENWHFDKAIQTNYKTSDQCHLKFETAQKEIQQYEGYVPDFFPGKHYGDYITLHISKQGKVKKFAPSDEAIDTLLKEQEEW